jgi:peptidoglycan/LPS O-acetylase OafA/YrhL
MKRRLQELDMLRVIATFTVISIHVTAAYVLVSPTGYLANQLGRFAVPLFIIMSGFLLQYADLNGTTKLSPKAFFQKRFDRILWPYLLWSLFYVAFTGILSHEFLATAKALPSHLLWGTGYYHLYFVIIMIQLYLLFPWLGRLLARHPRRLLLTSFILTFACQLVLYLSMLQFVFLPPQYTMAYLVIFPVWIFYFVLGMVAAQKKDQWQPFLMKQTPCLGVLWGISLAILLLDSYYTSSYGASIRPSVMLYTVSTYFLLVVLAARYHGDLPAWMVWFSKQSFLLYLIHPLFLTLTVYGATKIGLPELWGQTRGMAALYLLVCLLSCAATYLISLTPLADKLGGARKH